MCCAARSDGTGNLKSGDCQYQIVVPLKVYFAISELSAWNKLREWFKRFGIYTVCSLMYYFTANPLYGRIARLPEAYLCMLEREVR